MNHLIKVMFIAILGLISTASARCSFTQKLTQCNVASKGAFASAFAAAAATPALGCFTMTNAEWNKVGCTFPLSLRYTKVCAPATWSPVLQLFANAMALKTKILFRNPHNRHSLFNTSAGRAKVRHELAHILQQSGVNSFIFGNRYISGYCDAGCSYENNSYEVDARNSENDIC